MTTTGWPTPNVWLEALQRLESRRSPWPGPRPLRESDGEAALLIGRDDDVNEMLRLLKVSRFIHLTGRSGVGKSSLLAAGIIPQLRRLGYTVAACRDWNRFADRADDDFDLVLADALHESLPADQQARFASGSDLYWDLSDLQGTGVIILDQFEEFIRKEPDKREAALDFLMNLHVGTSVTIVLSYRSEYVDHFEVLNTDHRVSRQKSFRLGPIGVEAGKALIETPRRPADAGPHWMWEEEIVPEAAQAIHNLWSDACGARTLDHVAIGPLHLQGLLYVLASEADPERITVAQFNNFVADANEQDRHTSDQIMAYALERSASTRLRRARQAGLQESVGMDEFLLRGVSTLLTRAVPMLSSGGFKVEQLTSDLAERSLQEEASVALEQLEVREIDDEDPIHSLIEAVLAVLTKGAFNDQPGDESALIAADRAAIVAAAEASLNWGAPTWDCLLNERDSDRHTTAGPMMGLSAVAMLIEQLRRFAWALVWLYHLNLARITTSVQGQARVTLVHDGFGQALERWSDTQQERDGTWALYALATPEGESHRWGTPRGSMDVSQKALRLEAHFQRDISGDLATGEFAVHANLGLRGNAILFARFEHVVFVNCDLRGTLFQACTFNGVTFLNCRLDGTLFSDCTIEGGVLDRTAEVVPIEALDDEPTAPFAILRNPPQYIVNAEEAGRLALLMTRYRGRGSDGGMLLAQPPGNPAVPTANESDGRPLAPAVDGLMIQGSRVSALTFRATHWSGGRMVFRRVRGSGVEIAGLSGTPEVDFHRSIIRNVTFGQLDGATSSLRVRVQDCVAAQWWVATGFAGSLTAWRTQIAQIWIEPDEDFTPVLDASCDVCGVVADLEVRGSSLGAMDAARDLPVTDSTALEQFELSARSMDYRRVAEPLNRDSLGD
jgi:Novel STAND NTPase 1/Pentapeptide repeats (9 copies)